MISLNRPQQFGFVEKVICTNISDWHNTKLQISAISSLFSFFPASSCRHACAKWTQKQHCNWKAIWCWKRWSSTRGCEICSEASNGARAKSLLHKVPRIISHVHFHSHSGNFPGTAHDTEISRHVLFFFLDVLSGADGEVPSRTLPQVNVCQQREGNGVYRLV